MNNRQMLTPPILAREYAHQKSRIARYLHIPDAKSYIQYDTEYEIMDHHSMIIDQERIEFNSQDLYESLDFVSEKYIQPRLWRKLVPLADYNVLTYLAY